MKCKTCNCTFSGIFILLASISFANGRVRAARNLHVDMLCNIFHSPLHFFDTTPLGRITNRFTKDIDMIDMVIPATISAWLQTMLANLCTVIVISVGSPIFLLVLVPLGVIYYLVQVQFVALIFFFYKGHGSHSHGKAWKKSCHGKSWKMGKTNKVMEFENILEK